MEIRVAIAKNDGMNDEGLELMSGLAEEFFDKFLVSAGARNRTWMTDVSKVSC